MARTVNDIIKELRNLDEITVLELLDLSTEDLLDRFGDVVAYRKDEIELSLEEEQDPFDEDERPDF